MVEEVWNGGHTSHLPDLVAAEYVYFNSRGDELRGPQGCERRMTVLRSAFPDLRMEIEDILGEGDSVAYRVKTRGTFTGKLRDNQPTGKSFAARASVFARFAGGKLVHEVEYVGEPTAFEQLGIVWAPRKE
jgi:predicted ester cyclase